MLLFYADMCFVFIHNEYFLHFLFILNEYFFDFLFILNEHFSYKFNIYEIAAYWIYGCKVGKQICITNENI